MIAVLLAIIIAAPASCERQRHAPPISAVKLAHDQLALNQSLHQFRHPGQGQSDVVGDIAERGAGVAIKESQGAELGHGEVRRAMAAHLGAHDPRYNIQQFAGGLVWRDAHLMFPFLIVSMSKHIPY
jgi:hypothetical protein